GLRVAARHPASTARHACRAGISPLLVVSFHCGNDVARRPVEVGRDLDSAPHQTERTAAHWRGRYQAGNRTIACHDDETGTLLHLAQKAGEPFAEFPDLHRSRRPPT